MRRVSVAIALALAAFAVAHPARACVAGDTCCMALQAVDPNADVADIFHDKLGRDGTQLNAYGTLMNPQVLSSCLGVTTDPTTLGAYTCSGDGNTDPRHYSDFLDHRWVQRLRTCADGSQPADGTGGCYYAPAGLIYDLGGPANKVVLFPMIDHGPLPQEAFEYSVYLSDNPNATDQVDAGQPVDPMKWNEATLVKFFEKGWNPTDGGNNPNTDVSDDDVTVWALPCGVNFRYVSLVAGNHGNPAAVCEYDSSDDEIDAVAGLTEDETGICPDRDRDGHADAACGGDDCNDNDASVHPGAPEPCDAATDFNCDGVIGGCPSGEVCTQSVCLVPCGGGEFPCAGGEACVSGFCVAAPCGNNPPCPPGKVCSAGQCVDPCAGAVCPDGQRCVDGSCIDLCVKDKVTCPMNQYCFDGQCQAACPCVACPSGDSCDTSTGRCVPTPCLGIACPSGQVCSGGSCVDACSVVTCPTGDLCVAGQCQPDPCFGVDCGGGTCDPQTGHCTGGGLDGGASGDGGSASFDASTGGSSDAGAGGGDGGRRSVGLTQGACGCAVAARAPVGNGAFALGALVLLGFALSRRRRAPR